MKLTERQEKRLKWLLKKIRSGSLTGKPLDRAEKERVQILYDKLFDAYNGGQDTCATCGALFTPDPIQRGGECSSCSKHPLAFVQDDIVKRSE